MSQSEISPCLACGEPSANTVLCDECQWNVDWLTPPTQSPCLYCRKSTDNGTLCERCEQAFDPEHVEAMVKAAKEILAKPAGHTRINGPYDDYACKECTEQLIREYNVQPEDEPIYSEWHF